MAKNLFIVDISREMALKSQSNLSGGDAGAGGAGPDTALGRPVSCPRPGSTDCPGAGKFLDQGCSDRGGWTSPDSNLMSHYK